MTVKELKEKLREFDDSLEISLKDPPGNIFKIDSIEYLNFYRANEGEIPGEVQIHIEWVIN